MKTCDLIGPALDWAVAKCEGFKIGQLEDFDTSVVIQRPDGSLRFIKVGWMKPCPMLNHGLWHPSADWSQGGPIIEREKITPHADFDDWVAQAWQSTVTESGPTPLIAAMRCHVASKMGEEVEIPHGLE